MGRGKYGETSNAQDTSSEPSSQPEPIVPETIETEPTSSEPTPETSPTSQNISDVILENTDPDKGFLTSSGTYVNIYKNAGTNERFYTSDNTVKPAGERIDPRSSEGQIIQQQYAEQADRRADNLAQSQRFWDIREGQGSVKNLLFASQTPEQRRLTEKFFEERNLDINTPLNELSLSPKRYDDAREQLTTGNVPEYGVKVPDSIWLKTDTPTQSELKSFEEYRTQIVKDATTTKQPEEKITDVSEGSVFTSVSEIPLTEEQKKLIKEDIDNARKGEFNFVTITQQREGVPDSTITVPITGSDAYGLLEKEIKRVNTYGKPTDTVSIVYHTEKNNYNLPEDVPKIPIDMPMPVASFLGGGIAWFNYLDNQKQETEKEPSYNEWLTGIADPSFNQWNDGRDYRERGELGFIAPLQNYQALGGAIIQGGDVTANLQNTEFMDTGLDSVIRIVQAGLSPTSDGTPVESTGRRFESTNNVSGIRLMADQLAVEGELWQKYPRYYAGSLVTDIGMALATLPVGGVVYQTSAKIAVATAKASVKVMPALSPTNQLRVAVVARKLSGGAIKAVPTVFLGGVSGTGKTVTLSTLKGMTELELRAYDFVDLRKAVDEAPVISNFDKIRESEISDMVDVSGELTRRELDQIDPTSFKVLQQNLDTALVEGTLSRETLNTELTSALRPTASSDFRTPTSSSLRDTTSKLQIDNREFDFTLDYIQRPTTGMERSPMVSESFASQALPKSSVELIEELDTGIIRFPQTRIDILDYRKGRQIDYIVRRGEEEYNIRTNIQPPVKGTKSTRYETTLYGGIETQKQSFAPNIFVNPSQETISRFYLVPIEDTRFQNAYQIPKNKKQGSGKDYQMESLYYRYSLDENRILENKIDAQAITDYQFAKGELATLEIELKKSQKSKLAKVKTKFTPSSWTQLRRGVQSEKIKTKKRSQEELEGTIATLKDDIATEYEPKARESALRLFESEIDTGYIQPALAKLPPESRKYLMNDELYYNNPKLNELTGEERYILAQLRAEKSGKEVSIDDYYNLERVSGVDDAIDSALGAERFRRTEEAFIFADIAGSRTGNKELAESILEYRALKRLEKTLPSEKIEINEKIEKSLLNIQQNIISTRVGQTGIEMPLKASTSSKKTTFTGSRSRISDEIDEINTEITEKQTELDKLKTEFKTVEKTIADEKASQRVYLDADRDRAIGTVETQQGLYTQGQINYVLEGFLQSEAIVQGIYKGVRPTVKESKPFTGSNLPSRAEYNVERTKVSSEQLGSKTNYDVTVDKISIEELMKKDITSVSADPSDITYDQLKRALSRDGSIPRIDQSLGSPSTERLQADNWQDYLDDALRETGTQKNIVDDIGRQREYDRAYQINQSARKFLREMSDDFDDPPDIVDRALRLRREYQTEYNEGAQFFTNSYIREPINPQSMKYNTGANVPNLQGTFRTIEPDSPEKVYLELLREESRLIDDSNVLGKQISSTKERIRRIDKINKKKRSKGEDKILNEEVEERYNLAIKSIQDKKYFSSDVKERLAKTRFKSEAQFDDEIDMAFVTNQNESLSALDAVKKEYIRLKDIRAGQINPQSNKFNWMREGKTPKSEEMPITDAGIDERNVIKTRLQTRTKELEANRKDVENQLSRIQKQIQSTDSEIVLKVGLEQKSPIRAKLQASTKRISALNYQQRGRELEIAKIENQIKGKRSTVQSLKTSFDQLPEQDSITTVGAGFSINIGRGKGATYTPDKIRELQETLPLVGKDVSKTRQQGFKLERVLGDRNYSDLQNQAPDNIVFETASKELRAEEAGLRKVVLEVDKANKRISDTRNMVSDGGVNTQYVDSVIDDFDDVIKLRQNKSDSQFIKEAEQNVKMESVEKRTLPEEIKYLKDVNKYEVKYLKQAKKDYTEIKSILNEADKIHQTKQIKLEKYESEIGKLQDQNRVWGKTHKQYTKTNEKIESLEKEKAKFTKDIDGKLQKLEKEIPDLRISQTALATGLDPVSVGRPKFKPFEWSDEKAIEIPPEKPVAQVAESQTKKKSKKQIKREKSVYDAMVKAQNYNMVQPQGVPFMPIPIIRYPANTPQEIQDNQVDVQSTPIPPPQAPKGFQLDVPTPQEMSKVAPSSGVNTNVMINNKISSDITPKVDASSVLKVIQPLNQKVIQTPVQTPIQTPIQDQFRIQGVTSPIKITSRTFTPLVEPKPITQQTPTLPIPAFTPKLPYPTRKKKKKEKPKKKKYRKIYWDVSSTPFKAFNPKEYYVFRNEPRSVKFKEKRKSLD